MVIWARALLISALSIVSEIVVTSLPRSVSSLLNSYPHTETLSLPPPPHLFIFTHFFFPPPHDVIFATLYHGDPIPTDVFRTLLKGVWDNQMLSGDMWKHQFLALKLWAEYVVRRVAFWSPQTVSSPPGALLHPWKLLTLHFERFLGFFLPPAGIRCSPLPVSQRASRGLSSQPPVHSFFLTA